MEVRLSIKRFSSGPFHSGSSNRPCGFSPVADSVIEIYILNNWQNSYFGSMTCGVKAIMIIKTNPKLLKLHLPRTTVGFLVVKGMLGPFFR